MTVDAALAYLHFLSIILTGGFLVTEMVVCRPGMGPEQVRLLPRLDLLFFGAALAALATGLGRLAVGVKGLDFYLPNPAFHAKMALYLVIAGLSIRPTLRFIAWRRRLDQAGDLPPPAEIAGVRRLVHVEVALLALMPLMAVLMARGIGR